MNQLTRGSLKKILDGQNVTEPILQIMQMKNIQNNMDGMTRYKVTLFDGEFQHTFGILATQKNYLVENNELKIGSIIRLEEYAANVLSKDPPKVVVILLNFEILADAESKTTSPSAKETSYSKPPVQNENIEPKKPEAKTTTQNTAAKSFYNNKESQAQNSSKIVSTASSSSNIQPGTFNGFKVFGISNLNPYQNKWSIKARVTAKSNIRTYSNAKGEGKLFNVQFIDQTGEIKANGFNEQCDKFYELLQVDNVYYISRAQLKTANRQYSKVDNDYEMMFTNDTMIEQCHEADNLPHIMLNLVPLNELINKNANDFVDVIGVIKSCNEVSTIVTRQTNRELKKREISIVDDSNCAVNCTLWGQQAEDFDGSENPVVLLKGAKLGDYGGRSLSVTSSTVMQINPDIPEAHKVRGWFDQGGSQASIQELTVTGGGGGGQSGGVGMNSQSWKTLDLLKDEKLGMGDKADYFAAKAVILYAKKDNSMYMACPAENCNKKVIDQNDGTYRCEKCCKSFPNFKWRMILNVNIADFTESAWSTCFQETAEQILGIKADDLGELKNSNSSSYDEYFADCVFKEFNFKLRAKMETYNDERRVKVSVVSIEPVDYVANSKRLLQRIKTYAKSQI